MKSLLLSFLQISRGVGALSLSMASSSASRGRAVRTFLITGATDGIGLHTSKRLAEDGHALLIHGRKTGEETGTLVQDLEARGATKVAYLQADLSDLNQVHDLADKAIGQLRTWQEDDRSSSDASPALDVLINNAGVFDPDKARSAQGFDNTMGVNVLAPFVLTRKLLPCLARGDGARIVTTSSISQSWALDVSYYDKKPPDYSASAHSSYSHSKLGDLLFTARLAELLSPYEIQCLTMDPGTVNTKMLLAGWGACGINVHKANNTYKLATEEGYAFSRVPSGSYHFGGGGSRDANDGSKLDLFWEKLVSCTGVDYNDLSDLKRK